MNCTRPGFPIRFSLFTPRTWHTKEDTNRSPIHSSISTYHPFFKTPRISRDIHSNTLRWTDQNRPICVCQDGSDVRSTRCVNVALHSVVKTYLRYFYLPLSSAGIAQWWARWISDLTDRDGYPAAQLEYTYKVVLPENHIHKFIRRFIRQMINYKKNTTTLRHIDRSTCWYINILTLTFFSVDRHVDIDRLTHWQIDMLTHRHT